MIFHFSFPFIFSQSPIISLQSPIERGDITSLFPYKKGENQSAGALLLYMLKLKKRISLYNEKEERGWSICWSCSNNPLLSPGVYVKEALWFYYYKSLQNQDLFGCNKISSRSKSTVLFFSNRNSAWIFFSSKACVCVADDL